MKKLKDMIIRVTTEENLIIDNTEKFKKIIKTQIADNKSKKKERDSVE